MKRKYTLPRRAFSGCLLLLLSLILVFLCACDRTPLPSSGSETTSGQPTLPPTLPPTEPTTAATMPEDPPAIPSWLVALLADFSPTESVTVIVTRVGNQPELTQTETMTMMTTEDGGCLYRRESTTQKLLPIIIDEEHNIISAGGISEEKKTEYLQEGEDGACFPAVGAVLYPEEYAGISFTENKDGTCTLTCRLSGKYKPAWLTAPFSESLISGTLTIVASRDAAQINGITVSLYTWTDKGATCADVKVTYDYMPKHFSLPG